MATINATPTDYTGQPIGPTVTLPVIQEGTDDSPMPALRAPVAVLEAWVGYDPDRAKAALTREHGASQPRTGLIERLEATLKEIG